MLAQSERLCCDTESFGLGFPSSLPPKACGLVLWVTLSRVSQPVYNIEVHGEHVYQVGELGVLVHNSCEGIYVFMTTTGKTYVGQSVDVARRLAEHVNAGRLASAATATIIHVTGGKMSREIAEQMLINSLGPVALAPREQRVANAAPLSALFTCCGDVIEPDRIS